MFLNTALADAGAAAGGDWIGMLAPLVIVFAIMYFLVLRPQSKKMKEHQNMLAALTRGDRVVTSGGIVGKVNKVGDKEVDVEIANGVNVQVMRQMITSVLDKKETASPVKKAAAPKKKTAKKAAAK